MRRVAVIGDSAAAGHGLAEPDQAWARLVTRALHRHDGRATSLRTGGVDGADIACVMEQQLHLVDDAEVVLINVGINDALRCYPPTRIERGFRELLVEVHRRATPGARIALFGAPDLSVAPAMPAILRPPLTLLCRMAARIQRRVASEFGLEPIALPRQVLTPAVFGPDGFHPGPVGHRRLAAAMIERLLGEAWA